MITKRGNVNASFGDALRRKAPGLALIGSVATAHLAHKAYKQIMQNTRKKALIEDLLMTDPIIKNADKAEVMEYYALIDHMAPSISTEKPAVRELLQTFVRFGRVDMNTLKLLAETEKNKKQSMGTSIGDYAFDAAKSIGTGLM